MRGSSRLAGLVIAAAAFAALVVPATAAAAAPPNDNWVDRTALSFPNDTEAGTTAEATLELPAEDDINQDWAEEGSVWYSYTATADAFVTVDTCSGDPDPDTGITVFSGAGPIDSLTYERGVEWMEKCGAGHHGHSLRFRATNATVYSIVVGDSLTPTSSFIDGPFVLKIGLTPAVANNNLADAAELSSPASDGHFEDLGGNIGANKEAGEPNHAGVSGGASVWYRWTAPSNGWATASACSFFGADPLLAVYAADSYPLPPAVAENDNQTGTGPCGSFPEDSLTPRFQVVAGQEYLLAVDTHGGVKDSVILTMIDFLPCGVYGLNDTFAAAGVLTGSADTASGCNRFTSKEPGEPDHALNPGGASVWYQWTAPANGTATIDLAGSDFDTLLGVYTGNAPNALTEVASNDEFPGNPGRASKVTFAAAAGTTYRIAVDGWDGDVGGIALSLGLNSGTQAPPTTPATPGAGPTGQKAAALRKCKKKKGKKRKKCKQKAAKLPV